MKKDFTGQTLLEVLVALSAALIILSAITVIVVTSLSQAVNSKNHSLATQYAQEGMELTKSQIKSLQTSTYTINANKVFTPEQCNTKNIGSIFRRCVTISNNTLNNASNCGTLRLVTVAVSWTDGQCKGQPFCHTVPVTSCL